MILYFHNAQQNNNVAIMNLCSNMMLSRVFRCMLSLLALTHIPIHLLKEKYFLFLLLLLLWNM